MVKPGQLVPIAAGLVLAGVSAAAQAADPSVSDSSRWYQSEVWYALAAAAVVGLIGTGAFFLGVYLGFIAKASRRDILKFFHEPPLDGPTDTTFAWLRLTLFLIMGGLVAAVFQWAQGAVFAPIQAFVLGATWPSVVTRVMAQGGGDPPPPPPFGGAPAQEAPPSLPTGGPTLPGPKGPREKFIDGTQLTGAAGNPQQPAAPIASNAGPADASAPAGNPKP
jgi:hypothetical protein